MRQFTRTQGIFPKNSLLGVTLIEDVVLDLNCRDEITKTLRGLQEIYRCKPLLTKIKTVLTKLISKNTSSENGRQGMDLWVIFLLGSLRLSCNWDYDKLKTCYDNHQKIREMAGIDLFCDLNLVVGRQTIHDNISLFTPAIANEINQLVVEFGHNHLFSTKPKLDTRCDSFVFETNVHFPTDFNLLKDSVRKILSLGSCLATNFKISGWRETASQLNKFRNLYNRLSKMRHSNSKNDVKKQARKELIQDAVRQYLKVAQAHLSKAKELKSLLSDKQNDFEMYMDYTELFINQITRRVLNSETIKPDEKVYSIFEPYTEWICKGKAGVRQELGVKICIVEDQFGFILNYRTMYKEEDRNIAIELTSDTQKMFPALKSISFDKGFHSATDQNGENNQTHIQKLGVVAHLPVKGRRNKKAQEAESQLGFIAARKQHPAVESAINALESHGFDRCPDKGKESFERYTAMAISASNIHRIGAIIMARELEAERRKKRST